MWLPTRTTVLDLRVVYGVGGSCHGSEPTILPQTFVLCSGAVVRFANSGWTQVGQARAGLKRGIVSPAARIRGMMAASPGVQPEYQEWGELFSSHQTEILF